MLCSLYCLDTQWHIINSWVHSLPGMVWLSYDSWETTSRLDRCVLNICLTWLQYDLGVVKAQLSVRPGLTGNPVYLFWKGTEEQIMSKVRILSQYIFTPILCLLSLKYFWFWKLRNITQIYHRFSWGIFCQSGDKFIQAKCA